jgi:hypothetical protein
MKQIDIVTCRVVRVTKLMGSRSDDWIYWTSPLQVHLITMLTKLSSYFFWFFYYSHNSQLRHAYHSATSPESYVTTDGQSASLSWIKTPIWGLRLHFYYCQAVADLLMWDAFSDERTGLSFTIAAGPRQRSHSRVRVPWDSRSYFTVSDSRLPFSSLRTTRRVTVEVFSPTSTRDLSYEIPCYNC